ncbi:putative Transmembrane protein [Mycena venus]|uniref:Putative Transmembrane protein n=1 Tax=Mycena venus TaxID=2733690 RepID=A0A8H6XMU2_9AGAR|nr:putative Transmembrane protein [Mycena venus]
MVWHAVTPPPNDPSRDDIIWLAGPRLLGLIFNWGLLGVLTTQVYIYNVNFPKDKRVSKAIVYIVYVLDWAQTCAATYDGFQWFVYGWGDIPTLYGVFTDFLNVPLLSSIIGSIVQIFFGWRIWAISQSRMTFVVVVLLSCLQLGAGGAAAYYLYQDASEVTRSAGLVRAVGIRLGASVAVDTVIAVSMTYFLVRSRGEALGRMHSVLTRLIRLTVETGTITALAAIMDLLFFLKAHNALHQVTGVILCKLYSNTLLVLFNNRLVMANAAETTVHASQSLAFRAASRSQHETWNIRPTVLDSMELQTSRGRDVKGQAV